MKQKIQRKLQRLQQALKKPEFDISLAITLAFLVISLVWFRKSYVRLYEALRDFFTSYAQLFNPDIKLTVNEFSAVNLTDLGILPNDIDTFKIRLGLYGKLLINGLSVQYYGVMLLEALYYISLIILGLILPLFLIAVLYKCVLFKKVNTNHNIDTKPLKIVKTISTYSYMPAKRGITTYIGYLKEERKDGGGRYFSEIWFAVWALNFNVFTIIIEIAAFLYGRDYTGLYVQVYKLFLDLSVAITFFPVWCWVIIALIVYNYLRHKHARKKIEKIEKADEEYVANLPIATMFVAPMGAGKTTISTDMAITLNKRFRDKAYEILINNDLKFPCFPWINLEQCIKIGMERHTVYNLATCRQLVKRIRLLYNYNGTNKFLSNGKAVRKHLNRLYGYHYDNYTFDYDVERYGYTIYDNQAEQTLFDVVEIYAQAYFIYLVSTSLILSNYSVRIDDYLEDEGNFPKWNIDFFRRDRKEIKEHTHYSHRLDFDSVRLGTMFIKSNVFKDSVDFGIILITEIGKERANQKTIKFCYAPNGANPDNDLMSMDEKLVRHRGTVDNFPFVAYICDENRAASLNLNEQELFDVCHVNSRTDFKVVTSAFALDELIYIFARNLFEKYYKEDRYYRGNNTLIRSIIKNLFVVIHRHYIYNVYNLYAVSTVDITIADRRSNEYDKNKKYKLIKHKIHSARFDTSCWCAYYHEKTKRSKYGIPDIPEYRGLTAQFDELDGQHSYVAESMKRYVLGNGGNAALSEKRPEE